MDDDLRQAWLATLTTQLGVIESALDEATADVAAIRATHSVPTEAFERAAAPLRRSLPLIRGLVDQIGMGATISTAEQSAYLRWINELEQLLDHADGPEAPCSGSVTSGRRWQA